MCSAESKADSAKWVKLILALSVIVDLISESFRGIQDSVKNLLVEFRK